MVFVSERVQAVFLSRRSLSSDVSGWKFVARRVRMRVCLHMCQDGSLSLDMSGWEFVAARVRMGVCLRTCPDGSLSPDMSGLEFISRYVRKGVCLRTCPGGVYARTEVCVWAVFMSRQEFVSIRVQVVCLHRHSII